MVTEIDKCFEPCRVDLLARRRIVLKDVQDYLHGSGDPELLSLENHFAEGSDWVKSDILNDTDIAMLNHDLLDLKQIDTALMRMKEKTYGTCVHCAETIPLERLRVNPVASHCLACQEDVERRQHIKESTL